MYYGNLLPILPNKSYSRSHTATRCCGVYNFGDFTPRPAWFTCLPLRSWSKDRHADCTVVLLPMRVDIRLAVVRCKQTRPQHNAAALIALVAS